MAYGFESVSATGDDSPESIYADLGADEPGKPQKADPRQSPIHCFGGSGSVSASSSGTVTCTPQGVVIRPDSIEMSSTQAAFATITAMTVGGLPIMHGGSMPGESFLSTATYKLRPAINASPNNPLAITLTSSNTAALTYVFGVKGPVMRQQ